MKACIIHATTVPETLLYFFQGQFQMLSSQGFVVHAVSSPGPLLNQFSTDENVAVHSVRMTRKISPFRDAFSILRFVWLLRTLRPEIVHAHTPKAGFVAMTAAFICRIPVRIYHIHGMPVDTCHGLKRRLLIAMERLSCRLANRVFCVGPSLQSKVLQLGICNAEKSRVLNNGSINGIDSIFRFNPESHRESRAAFRTKYSIPSDAVVIGYVGRIVCDKGINELYSAWLKLRDEYHNAFLLFVGYPERRDAIPKKTWDRINQDERIIVTGFTRELAPAYAAMDVFVLPSYREGLPVAPLEASAMQIPVITTYATGCRDVVQDGRTGLVINIGDVDALNLAIRRYLDSPSLRKKHGRNARRFVRETFSREAIWEELATEYRILLSRNSQPKPRNPKSSESNSKLPMKQLNCK